MKDLAVLVVDMQDQYLVDVDINDIDKLISSQLKVLDYARWNKVPVIDVNMDKRGPTTPFIRNFMDDLPFCIPLKKNYSSAFDRTDLAYKLDGLDTKNLLLTGIYASRCVVCTALDAVARGFNIMTAEDLVADQVIEFDLNNSEGAYSTLGVYEKDSSELLKQIVSGDIVSRFPDLDDVISDRIGLFNDLVRKGINMEDAKSMSQYVYVLKNYFDTMRGKADIILTEDLNVEDTDRIIEGLFG